MLTALKEEESVAREILTALNLLVDAANQELASLHAELAATNREIHEMARQRQRLVVESSTASERTTSPTDRLDADRLARRRGPRAQAREAVERARSLVSRARACRQRAEVLLDTSRTLRSSHDRSRPRRDIDDLG